MFRLDTDLGKIDLLTEAAGLGTFEEVAAGSIGAKRTAARDADFGVLHELESLLEAEEP